MTHEKIIQNTCTLAFVHPVAGSDIVGNGPTVMMAIVLLAVQNYDAHQSRDAKFGCVCC